MDPSFQKEVLLEAQRIVNGCSREKISHTGLETGLEDLNYFTNNLIKGSLTLIGARPSMGKTAFSLWLAYCNALKSTRSAFFTPASSQKLIIQRLLAMDTRLDPLKLVCSYVTSAEAGRLIDQRGSVASLPLTVIDEAGLNLRQFRQQVAWLKKYKDVSLVILDDITETLEYAKYRNDPDGMYRMSGILKKIAKSYDIHLIVTAPVNCECEQRDGWLPRIEDLPGDGVLSLKADCVMFPFRAEYYDPTDANRGVTDIYIHKNKFGRLGSVQAYFNRDGLRFEDLKGEGFEK